MHRLARHVDEVVFALWLGSISIGDLENNCSSFLLDVIEQIFWRIEDVEEKVDGLFLLSTIEKLKGRVAAGDAGDVLAVDFEIIGVATESKRVFPADPPSSQRIVQSTLSTRLTYH